MTNSSLAHSPSQRSESPNTRQDSDSPISPKINNDSSNSSHAEKSPSHSNSSFSNNEHFKTAISDTEKKASPPNSTANLEKSNSKLSLNCNLDNRNDSPYGIGSSSSSISPVSSSSEHNTKLSLKRSRDSSTDNSDTVSRSSPHQPVAKAAKMGYSIMNILGGKDKKETNSVGLSSSDASSYTSNKDNAGEVSSSQSPSPVSSSPTMPSPLLTNSLLQQQLAAAAANSQANNFNPFMLNPFLAAAAAQAAQGANNPAANPAFLNNLALLSNFGLNQNNQSPNGLKQQQNPVDFWPWLGLSMSALYGLDIDSIQNQQQQQQLQQQQQQLKNKNKFLYTQSTSPSLTTNRNSPSQHPIDQQAQFKTENETNDDEAYQTKPSMRHSSLTPNNNNNRNPCFGANNMNGSSRSANNRTNSDLNSIKLESQSLIGKNGAGGLSPSSNKHFLAESKSYANHMMMENARKMLNRSIGDDDEHEDASNENMNENLYKRAHGGASLGDDDDLDDDNLDGVDEEDDDDPNGDSFDANHRKKKTRTVFSRNQVFQLESTFDMKRYLSSSERSSLANSLQLTETQIKIWFQNRRNKWKRQLAADLESGNGLSNGSIIHHHQQSMPAQASSPHHLNHSNNNQMGMLASQQIHRAGNGQLNSSSSSSSSSSQRLVRVPVLYHQNQNESTSKYLISPDLDASHLLQQNLVGSGSTSSLSSSSSSSSPSAQTSQSKQSFNNPSAAAAAAAAVLNNMAAVHAHSSHFNSNSSNPNQSVNSAASLLSPSMLAAAAAASSLYYAAANQSSSFPSQFQNVASNASQSLKQTLSSIL